MEQNTNMTKDDLLRLARRRVFLKKVIRWHVILFVIINALLCVIFYLTTPGGYFWPMWSILGWGVGLIVHIAVTVNALSLSKGKQDSVEKEYDSLVKEFNKNNEK